MKSLMRWLTALGMGSLVAVGSGLSAVALEVSEIEARLQEIPVFTVTDNDGAPLVASLENQRYAGAFIFPQDAIAFRNQVISENPEFAEQIKITPVSLKEIYNLDRQQAAIGSESVDFVYVPTPSEVEFAESLLNNQQELQGVPLFAVKISTPGNNDNQSTYLTLPRTTRNAQGEPVQAGSMVPFFFSQEQARNLASQYDQLQQQEGGSATAVLEVHTLEILLKNWEERDESGLAQIWLIPSPDSLSYINANQ